MLIIIMLFIITFTILFLIIKKKLKLKRIQNNKDEIKNSFGKKTEDQFFEKELIDRYWEGKSAKITEIDKIDDITWYDLEMDQVYCIVNNCKSSAGDQILYSILHEISVPTYEQAIEHSFAVSGTD